MNAGNIYINELPLGLPGKVIGSPMPFGHFDPSGASLRHFKAENVSVVVILNEEDEYRSITGRDIKALYMKEGMEVIHLPTRDFDVPPKEELTPAIEEAIEHARAGRNVAVHCHAGMGRTGMFVAIMAREVLGLSGREAVDWVRRYINGAIQTDGQETMVIDY